VYPKQEKIQEPWRAATETHRKFLQSVLGQETTSKAEIKKGKPKHIKLGAAQSPKNGRHNAVIHESISQDKRLRVSCAVKEKRHNRKLGTHVLTRRKGFLTKRSWKTTRQHIGVFLPVGKSANTKHKNPKKGKGTTPRNWAQ